MWGEWTFQNHITTALIWKLNRSKEKEIKKKAKTKTDKNELTKEERRVTKGILG